jgi:SAM-dependent methyltransferase
VGHIPSGASILDIGCGDGRISSEIMRLRPDVQIEGVEVLVPDKTYIPVRQFDGIQVPAAERSYDAVLLVDVLHHSDNAEALFAEAGRIGSKLIVKDVMNDGFLADFTLRVMDLLGNERLGVACPFNFWPRQRWLDTFNNLKLTICSCEPLNGLYPWPAGLLFERSMHFVATLRHRQD